MTRSPEREVDGRVTLRTTCEELNDPLRRRVRTRISDRPGDRAALALGEFTGPDEDRARVQSALYHLHRPRLEQHGFVDWGHEIGAVTRGPNDDELRPVASVREPKCEGHPGAWT